MKSSYHINIISRLILKHIWTFNVLHIISFAQYNISCLPVRVYLIIIVITMSAIGDLMMGDSPTQQWIDNLNMDVMFVLTL